jgi:hypothetical protein
MNGLAEVWPDGHPEIALEMATMDAQETGKVPLWLKALTPGIWPKAKSPKAA